MPGYKQIWVKAWKKIWKPVVISEWFPTPDHHHDHHHEHIEHGWDRKDENAKVLIKRDNSATTTTQLKPVASGVFNDAKIAEGIASPAIADPTTNNKFRFPGA